MLRNVRSHSRALTHIRCWLLVTTQAPTHFQRGVLIDHFHRFHRPVAFLTPHTCGHMTLVREINKVGQAVDAHPWDRLLPLPVVSQLPNFRPAHSDELMAAHTALDRWKAGGDAASRRGVAILAVDLFIASVQFVAERDGLLW